MLIMLADARANAVRGQVASPSLMTSVIGGAGGAAADGIGAENAATLFSCTGSTGTSQRGFKMAREASRWQQRLQDGKRGEECSARDMPRQVAGFEQVGG